MSAALLLFSRIVEDRERSLESLLLFGMACLEAAPRGGGEKAVSKLLLLFPASADGWLLAARRFLRLLKAVPTSAQRETLAASARMCLERAL